MLNLRGDASDHPRFSSDAGHDEMEDVQYTLEASRETVSEQLFTGSQPVARSFDDSQAGSIEVSGHQKVIQNMNVTASGCPRTAGKQYHPNTCFSVANAVEPPSRPLLRPH